MSASNIPQTNDVTLVIPAAIAALPDLNLLEQAALAHIYKFPGCSNAGLAKRTGLSQRGVEALLARLRKRRLIEMSGRGSARRHELTFPVEPRTKCGKTEVVESHKKCEQSNTGESHTVGVCKSEETTLTFINRRLAFYKNCFNSGMLGHAREHLEAARARLELETGISVEEKAKIIATLVPHENRVFALEVGAKMAAKLPPAKQERLALALCNAPPDNLVLFRQQVEAGHLATNAIEVLALTDG
jgi:hypothetical protein